MAVTETITLPAQPAAGSSVYVPLGGDGLTAPHSAYSIRSMAAVMDVSGGLAQVKVVLDDRFCSLVSFVTAHIENESTSQVVRFQISGSSTPSIIDNVTLLGFVAHSDCSNVWYPPTWVLPGSGQVCTLTVAADNVDGDTLSVSAVVYNFDIRVRELTNVGFLGWARGPVAS